MVMNGGFKIRQWFALCARAVLVRHLVGGASHRRTRHSSLSHIILFNELLDRGRRILLFDLLNLGKNVH